MNNVKDFEDDLTDNYGITCHLCDFSSDEELFKTPLRQGLQTCRKKWLDPNGGDDSISLDDWANEESPDSHEELLVQMDIEEAEYKNLIAYSEATLMRFRIVVVEVHELDVSNDPTRFETELGPLLRRLDQYHICVHAHPNNCCGEFRLEESYLMIPRVIELTFLRRDRVYHADNHHLRHPLLPLPLDIDFNVRDNPPLLLEGDWLDSESRSQDSFEALSTWKK